jgi:CPA2 family monovalent cation:H+ antiporter-2
MIALPILSRYSTVVWDKSVEICPGKVMSGLVRLNNARNTLYTNVAASSKRTRREVERLMTLNYVCVLLVILVEILFVLINPAFAEWFAEYIGGTVLLWSVLMLLMNLFGIYLPIYVIVHNLRTARTISRQRNEGDSVKEYRESPTIAKMFMMTSTTMVSMMVAIIVLIVVPNNLGIWEHIIVMVLALAGLFYYNRKSIQKMFEGGQIIETQGTIGGDKQSMDEQNVEGKQTVVSIDPEKHDD